MPRRSQQLLENWRRLPVHPRTTWMKTIQKDMKCSNLSLEEAIAVAHNRPLWKLMSIFGATALLVVHARNDDGDDECVSCMQTVPHWHKLQPQTVVDLMQWSEITVLHSLSKSGTDRITPLPVPIHRRFDATNRQLIRTKENPRLPVPTRTVHLMHVFANDIRWPSVPDFLGQSLFLTSSPGKNQRSPGTPICPVFGLSSRICPDLTNCCVVPNWTRAVLWVLTIHTVRPDRLVASATLAQAQQLLTSYLFINVQLDLQVVNLTEHWFQFSYTFCIACTDGGTAAAVPPPFRPSDPALCGSRP